MFEKLNLTVQRIITNKNENFNWHLSFKGKQNKDQNTKQCLNKKECTHIRKMQNKKQTTKQMGCERKESIASCSNFWNPSHVTRKAPSLQCGKCNHLVHSIVYKWSAYYKSQCVHFFQALSPNHPSASCFPNASSNF
jgi:hypothetical protein